MAHGRRTPAPSVLRYADVHSAGATWTHGHAIHADEAATPAGLPGPGGGLLVAGVAAGARDDRQRLWLPPSVASPPPLPSWPGAPWSARTAPGTNGKVERLNRTLLREWAYARVFTTNAERRGPAGGMA